jgi:hypothetical protein
MIIEVMPYEIIETDKYLMRIHDDNLFEYIVKPGATINAADVIAGKKSVVARYPNSKFFVLAEGIEFFTITSEAREVAASKEHGDNTHAVAFYTTNVSIFLLGEMYNKINKPHVPTKFFYSKESAWEWLSEQKKKVTGTSNFP